MKKGFTLVEMLIVVVVLVTLMTIAFRLSSTGSDQSARAATVSRMQRLENCLSGYYAAYGSYPPVALHTNRDWKMPLDDDGEQDESREDGNIWGWSVKEFKLSSDGKWAGKEKEEDAWRQVREACKAQPLDCRFPFRKNADGDDYVTAVLQASYEYHKEKGDVSEKQLARLQRGADSGTANIGRFSAKKGFADWKTIKLFKFGLMSYLLPRYQVMIRGNRDFFTGGFAQWDDNNPQPTNPMNGRSKMSWQKIFETVDPEGNASNEDKAALVTIPSQAACARWLPNLEKVCCGNANCTVFGVEIINPDENRMLSMYTKYPEIYTANGQPYCLDGITVKDGWGTEFFYYSPAPYQTYTLWSAGRNGRTFPVWVDRGELDPTANEHVSAWVEDDIIHLSN